MFQASHLNVPGKITIKKESIVMHSAVERRGRLCTMSIKRQIHRMSERDGYIL